MPQVEFERCGVNYTLNDNGEIFVDGSMLHDGKSEFCEMIDGKGFVDMVSVKRLVAQHFIPNPNNFRYSMFKSSSRCVNSDNIFWSKSNRKK